MRGETEGMCACGENGRAVAYRSKQLPLWSMDTVKQVTGPSLVAVLTLVLPQSLALPQSLTVVAMSLSQWV
jgi:hypothetical protein